VDLMPSWPSRSFPRHRAGVSWLVSVVAVAAACLALSPSALAGDPLTSIKINEVETENRRGDFIELMNIAATSTDVSGLVLKHDASNRSVVIPGGTSVRAGGFLAVYTRIDDGFTFYAPDAARVFMPDGTTQIDSYSWTAHAVTTYGRCPDGTGAFVTTVAATGQGPNACPRPLVRQAWPGSASVTTADGAGVLGGGVSGLAYEGSGSASPGVLWAVDSGDSLLLRLVWDGARWVRDTANGWSAGKALSYGCCGQGGAPDAEGVTLTDAGAARGVYVASERDTANSGVSRISVLRYDVSEAGTTLSPNEEWDLTHDLPAVGADAGAAAVAWVPDGDLVAAGFPYEPKRDARFQYKVPGLFFVGLEGNGAVYVYALGPTSYDDPRVGVTRVAAFASGFPSIAALHWDSATNQLWVVCDDDCGGRSRVFQVDTLPGPSRGHFVPVADYARPTDMANLNNEGFTIPPASECVDGSKPVLWADAGNTDGHVLRAGTIPCFFPDGADFNGDGFADLAVGIPDEDVGGVADAGAVTVIYGNAAGLYGTRNHQLITQNGPNIADSAETGDHFGAAIATGDLNGDGLSDLIIGAPDEDIEATRDAGAVHVLLGAPLDRWWSFDGGVTATGSQFWHQDVSGVADDAQAGDRFGAALAAAEHTGDGGADVAIGAPSEDLGSIADAGVVHLLRGDTGGLTATGSQHWHQDRAGIADSAQNGDRFGAALAAGELGGSAEGDLAIGAPAEDLGADTDAGAVHVLPGGASGLTATGSQLWHQDSTGVADSAQPGDEFGSSLAAGDVGGSSGDDLIIGADREDRGAVSDAGVVHLLPGGVAGPTATGSQLWHQDAAGVADSAENGDRFGQALAIGNFGNDWRKDLAVGVPHEGGFGGLTDAGVVHVLPGSASFLSATGSQFWHQNVAGIIDSAESGDTFGSSLAAGSFQGTATQAGLAVGAPGESVRGLLGAGAANAIYGSASGLAPAGNQLWTQSSPNVIDIPETDDHFGAPLE
jgi:hypothetical protein